MVLNSDQFFQNFARNLIFQSLPTNTVVEIFEKKDSIAVGMIFSGERHGNLKAIKRPRQGVRRWRCFIFKTMQSIRKWMQFSKISTLSLHKKIYFSKKNFEHWTFHKNFWFFRKVFENFKFLWYPLNSQKFAVNLFEKFIKKLKT